MSTASPPLTALKPIDRPSNLLVRLAFWWSKRKYGKVIAPLRVVYSRFPALLRAQMKLVSLAEHGLSIPASLRLLLSLQTSQLNGCTFCADLHRTEAAHVGLSLDHLRYLHQFDTHAAFTVPQRAALSAATAIVQHRHMSDEVLTELRKHFSERQITEIGWMVCYTSYFNLLAHTFGITSDELCPIPSLTQ